MFSPPRTSSYSVDIMCQEHNYYDNGVKSTGVIFSPKTGVMTAIEQLNIMKKERDMLLHELISTKLKIQHVQKPVLRFDTLEQNDGLMKKYTGMPTYSVFVWFFDQIKHKIPYLQCYIGETSFHSKYYQTHEVDRPGPERKLDAKSEMLLTLMKIRLNLINDDLAFRFDISVSLVSKIISTWIPFLGYELGSLVQWPKPETIRGYYPKCFEPFGLVIGIIDCTEVKIQKPSLAEANSKYYSAYKGAPTAKFLVACSPVGTVSFVSDIFSGATSDKDTVLKSKILQKFEQSLFEFDERLTVLADKGFQIQELLLPYDVRLVIPPFVKNKQQFTVANNARTKKVANARIHVERVIGRIKEFHILQSDIPLDLLDLLGHIFKICSGILNLCPPLIPV